VEIEGYKNANTRDAAILAQVYAWLENAVVSGENLTELDASEKLLKLRK